MCGSEKGHCDPCLEQKKRTFRILISLPLASLRGLVRLPQTLVCHALTDMSSKLINGKIRPYRHPGNGVSKSKNGPLGPSCLSLSHRYMVCVCVLMDASLAADEVDSFEVRQTIPVYTSGFTRVTSCRRMCVRDMNLTQLSDGTLAGQMARGEGQNKRGRTEQCHEAKKTNLTHIYLSNCLFPV